MGGGLAYLNYIKGGLPPLRANINYPGHRSKRNPLGHGTRLEPVTCPGSILEWNGFPVTAFECPPLDNLVEVVVLLFTQPVHLMLPSHAASNRLHPL